MLRRAWEEKDGEDGHLSRALLDGLFPGSARLKHEVFFLECLPVQLARTWPDAAGRSATSAVVLLLTAVSLPLLGYLLPVTIGLAILLWLLGERSPVRFAVALLLLG